jgi:serine/threonine protein kinase
MLTNVLYTMKQISKEELLRTGQLDQAKLE